MTLLSIRRNALCFIAALLLFPFQAFGGDKIYMVTEDGHEVPKLIETAYLWGIWHGVMSMQAQLMLDGSPMICPNPDHVISRDEFFDLMYSRLTGGGHKAGEFAVAAVSGLRDFYPCK